MTQSLQKHIVSELLKLPLLGQNQHYPWAVIERRLELVGGLRSLVSDDEAWVTYRNVRGQQLEELFNSLLPDNDSENVNYKEFCCNCEAVVDRISEMIEEDFTVLCTGVFKKIGGNFDFLDFSMCFIIIKLQSKFFPRLIHRENSMWIVSLSFYCLKQ